MKEGGRKGKIRKHGNANEEDRRKKESGRTIIIRRKAKELKKEGRKNIVGKWKNKRST